MKTRKTDYIDNAATAAARIFVNHNSGNPAPEYLDTSLKMRGIFLSPQQLRQAVVVFLSAIVIMRREQQASKKATH